MNNATLPHLVSTAEIQRKFRTIMLQTKRRKSPTFILNSNDPQGVLVDYSSWVDIVAKLKLQEEKDALLAIKAYKKEKRRGYKGACNT